MLGGGCWVLWDSWLGVCVCVSSLRSYCLIITVDECVAVIIGVLSWELRSRAEAQIDVLRMSGMVMDAGRLVVGKLVPCVPSTSNRFLC